MSSELLAELSRVFAREADALHRECSAFELMRQKATVDERRANHERKKERDRLDDIACELDIKARTLGFREVPK